MIVKDIIGKCCATCTEFDFYNSECRNPLSKEYEKFVPFESGCEFYSEPYKGAPIEMNEMK